MFLGKKTLTQSLDHGLEWANFAWLLAKNEWSFYYAGIRGGFGSSHRARNQKFFNKLKDWSPKE